MILTVGLTTVLLVLGTAASSDPAVSSLHPIRIDPSSSSSSPTSPRLRQPLYAMNYLVDGFGDCSNGTRHWGGFLCARHGHCPGGSSTDVAVSAGPSAFHGLCVWDSGPNSNVAAASAAAASAAASAANLTGGQISGGCFNSAKTGYQVEFGDIDCNTKTCTKPTVAGGWWDVGGGRSLCISPPHTSGVTNQIVGVAFCSNTTGVPTVTMGTAQCSRSTPSYPSCGSSKMFAMHTLGDDIDGGLFALCYLPKK